MGSGFFLLPGKELRWESIFRPLFQTRHITCLLYHNSANGAMIRRTPTGRACRPGLRSSGPAGERTPGRKETVPANGTVRHGFLYELAAGALFMNPSNGSAQADDEPFSLILQDRQERIRIQEGSVCIQ